MTTPAAAATTVNTGPASTDPAVSNTGNPIPADQPNKPAAQTPEQIAEAAKKAEADKAAADKQAADEAAAKEIEASWEYSGNESVDAAVDLMKNSGLKGDDAKLIFGNALETGDLSIVNVEQLEKRIGKKTATAVMALAKAAVDAGKAQTAKIVAEAAKVAGGEKEYFELVKWAKAKEKVDPAFKKDLDDIRDLVNAGGRKTAIGVKELLALHAADPNAKGLNNGGLLKPGKAGAATVGNPLNRVDFFKEEAKVHADRKLTPKAREDALADLRLRRAAGRKLGI